MELMNGHGGGIAWIKDGKVRYEKGINAKRMIKMIRKNHIKAPAIIHFRIESVGGIKKSLCHPFPIEDNIPLALSGTADKVLFHNGNWNDWEEFCLKAVIAKDTPFLSGDCSDTRAIAWLVHLYGDNILNLIDGFNKFAILTPEGITKYGKGWEKHEKIEVSNTYFDRKVTTQFTYYEDDRVVDNIYNEKYWDVWKKKHSLVNGSPVKVNFLDDDKILGENIGDGMDSLYDEDSKITSPEDIIDEAIENGIDVFPINIMSGKQLRKMNDEYDNGMYA